MSVALADVVEGLAVAVVLLVVALIGIRVTIRYRRRQQRRFRPWAELSLAEYLAGGQVMPDVHGRGGRAILLDVALEALGELRGAERARLRELLTRLGYVDDAMAALGSRRRIGRRRAAEVLAEVAADRTIPALLAGLDDRDALVRSACARTLAEIGDEAATPAIIATAERDILVAPGSAAAVVLALGHSRPQALAPLFSADVAPEAKAVAVAVAGGLRLPQLAPLLRACLSERDDLAADAARGLGQIGDGQSVEALLDLARDDHRALPARGAAVTALGSIGDITAVPLLASLLAAGDWSLRMAAAQALARLGGPGAAELRRALSSARPEVRLQAEAALEP